MAAGTVRHARKYALDRAVLRCSSCSEETAADRWAA